MAEVLHENVKWRKKDIEHAALKIIGFYIQDLPYLNRRGMVGFAIQVNELLRNRGFGSVEYEDDAFSEDTYFH